MTNKLPPLSFNCMNGCGSCGVKLVNFVTHETQAHEGAPWVTVASEPQVVSTCCGSAVEVWDERKQEIVAKIEARQAVRDAVIERCERESGVCVMVHDKDSKAYEPCDASNCRSMRGHSASLGIGDAVPEGFTEDQVSWAAIRAGIGNVVCGRLIDELKLIAAAKEDK